MRTAQCKMSLDVRDRHHASCPGFTLSRNRKSKRYYQSPCTCECHTAQREPANRPPREVSR